MKQDSGSFVGRTEMRRWIEKIPSRRQNIQRLVAFWRPVCRFEASVMSSIQKWLVGPVESEVEEKECRAITYTSYLQYALLNCYLVLKLFNWVPSQH